MAKHSKLSENERSEDRLALEDRLTHLRENAREINSEIEATTHKLEAVAAKERQEDLRLWELLKAFIPTPDHKKVLNDRKIEIIYTNKITAQGRGAKALSSPGFDVAKALNSLFQELGVTAKVTARTWSTTGAGIQNVTFEGENGTGKLPSNRNFEIPARYIKRESKSIKEKGKNYIIITTGNIYGGNIKELTEDLAALKHNPQATLDFVICSESEKTPIDRLIKELKHTSAGQQVNSVKIGSEGEVLDAVKGVIKNIINAQPFVADNIDASVEGPKVGQRMEDGAIFAGISPDTNMPMYAAPADESLPLSFNAAKECAEKKSHETGKEYRVPSENELSVLFNNRAAIGGFNITDTGPAAWYMSSTPFYYDTMRCQCFSDEFRALSKRDVLKQQKQNNQKGALFHLLINRLLKREENKKPRVNPYPETYAGFKGLGYRDSGLSVRLVRN